MESIDEHLPTASLHSSTTSLPIGTVYEGDLPQAPPTTTPTGADPSGMPSRESAESKKSKEERKLAIMMMTKKRKRLFEHIMKARKKKSREVSELKRKRKEYDETVASSKRIKIV